MYQKFYYVPSDCFLISVLLNTELHIWSYYTVSRKIGTK